MINTGGWILLGLFIIVVLVVVILTLKMTIREIKSTKKTSRKIIGILLIIFGFGYIIWTGRIFTFIIKDNLIMKKYNNIEWISNSCENMVIKKGKKFVVLYQNDEFSPRNFVQQDSGRFYFKDDALPILSLQ